MNCVESFERKNTVGLDYFYIKHLPTAVFHGSKFYQEIYLFPLWFLERRWTTLRNIIVWPFVIPILWIYNHLVTLFFFPDKVPDEPKITYVSGNIEASLGQSVRLFCEAFVGKYFYIYTYTLSCILFPLSPIRNNLNK